MTAPAPVVHATYSTTNPVTARITANRRNGPPIISRASPKNAGVISSTSPTQNSTKSDGRPRASRRLTSWATPVKPSSRTTRAATTTTGTRTSRGIPMRVITSSTLPMISSGRNRSWARNPTTPALTGSRVTRSATRRAAPAATSTTTEPSRPRNANRMSVSIRSVER